MADLTLIYSYITCDMIVTIPFSDQTNEGNEFYVGFFRNRFGRASAQEEIDPVLWITTKQSTPVNFNVYYFWACY